MNIIYTIAIILVLVGALNWGLVSMFEFDLVAGKFGNISGLIKIVYGLVGLSPIYIVVMYFFYMR